MGIGIDILSENMRRFNTKNLSEQQAGTTATAQKKSALTSDASKKVYKLFIEYLKENPKTTYNDSTVIQQHINKLKTITENDVADVFNFFKSKGYSAKNADITAFQKDLGVEKFKTPLGEKEFADGTFGMATALAAIEFYISGKEDLIKTNKPNFTYGDSAIGGAKAAALPQKPAVQVTRTGAPVSISTATQSTK